MENQRGAAANASLPERFFSVRESGSSVRTEVLAGITTFLTSMYIIVVNPAILSQAGIPFPAALSATVLVSFAGSCAMGLYARNPVLVAPGMGMNALFAFVMVHAGNMPWQTALGCVFWSGVIFAVLAAFNVRRLVVDAIPANLRHALSCGIGLFISLIGLVNAKFVVSDPVTIVRAASLNPVIVTFLAGLAITTVLVARRITGALMIGIVVTTILAIPIGRLWGDGSAYWPVAMATPTLVNWNGLVAAPDFSALFQLDLVGALKVAYWPFIFVMLFTSFFDALSTFMAVSNAGNLLDADGNPRNIRQSMIVDAFSALVSAPLGTSPANAYIESAAGISAGGRTGLVAVVAAVCFLPFLFLSPLLSLVPAIATAPALVLVGVFMMEPITRIEWHRFDEAIPAFIAMILIPLTYSITAGIAYGFLAFVVLKLFVGRAREVKPAMWTAAALSGLLLAQL
ncbi:MULTISPECIES: NCS2 family permease [Burkholderiaceae]|uniref:NCS2 family permease n=1 Tax=Burkholderiaceae TaxID=119060 RepID=UPI00095F139B|nr:MULTISPECIES: NCS2 family permease [Burkholderiaceae]MCF2133104.1 NCS2 family permease [Mycetohabitans sp. B3]MCG1038558.1 NCS2 family permease [Mycetohabitans sp. B7]SIT80689.1 putative MFS transporter, AGZA family, xanthine/uracil permease [Burkholderia sp. b14]